MITIDNHNNNAVYSANCSNTEQESSFRNALSNAQVPLILSSRGAIEALGTNSSEFWAEQFEMEVDLSGRGE